jgi:hypothetical protein
MIWKQFKNSNYSVSNSGLVRNDKTGKVLAGGIETSGYRIVDLFINKKSIIYPIHILVAMLFLGFIPDGRKKIVHHKDSNKLNNNDWNLEIITFRSNCSIERTAKSSSKYVGVTWCKLNKKWLSRIRISGKLKFLGYFDNEDDAGDAYQKALNSLNKD